MKMLYKYSLIIASVFFLFSCEKETEGISRVTYFCDLELKGNAVELVALGGSYDEPGWVASENEEDVSDNVVVTGTVNTQVAGSYILTYLVNNTDGYPKTAQRQVIVYDTTPSPIASGIYYVDSSSSRSGLGGAPAAPATEFRTKPSLVIFQSSPGRFTISDLFGGYYSIGRGYGALYEISGIVSYDGANFSLVSSKLTPWGDTFTAARGTYNAGTKTLALQVDYATYTFHLNIVEN